MATGQTWLVVDDDETIRTAFTMALEEAGYVVVTATNAGEALVYLRKHLPPALMTFRLPGNAVSAETPEGRRGLIASTRSKCPCEVARE